jgi:ankyrin repeat protein
MYQRAGQTFVTVVLCFLVQLTWGLRLLLARDDIHADSRADCGRTPLEWAAISGHEVIVELLLARDEVKRDTRDIQHALELAEDWHHEGVAKLLREGHVG